MLLKCPQVQTHCDQNVIDRIIALFKRLPGRALKNIPQVKKDIVVKWYAYMIFYFIIIFSKKQVYVVDIYPRLHHYTNSLVYHKEHWNSRR